MKIFKYTIRDMEAKISPPQGAEFLSLQVQKDWVVIWCLVNEDFPPQVKRVHLYYTGQDIPGDGPQKYLGTAQIESLVLHAFGDF